MSEYLCLEELVVGRESYLQDFQTHLMPLVRPSWRGVELECKVFDTGITNMLVAIFDKSKGLKGSRDDVILVRVNGAGSEKVVNRADELVCIVTLHKAGLFPPVHAKFRNGLCYGYLPGRQVGVAEVREEEMSGKIARLMARLHCVQIPQHFEGRRPQLWAKIGGWLDELPGKFEDPNQQNSFVLHFGSVQELVKEVCWLQSVVSTSCKCPVVFCHNDLLIANFVYDDVTGEVRMIDYEYGGPNYLAFDIADHFSEFAGVEEVNFDLCPDETFQKRWIGTYLEERAKMTGEAVDSDSIHCLYKEVVVFQLAAHLFWSIWSLLQSLHSTIDFDYMGYAILRYGEYCRRKDASFLLRST